MRWRQSSSTYRLETASSRTCSKTGVLLLLLRMPPHIVPPPSRSPPPPPQPGRRRREDAHVPQHCGHAGVVWGELVQLEVLPSIGHVFAMRDVLFCRFGARVNACDIGVARRNVKADDKKQEK